MDELPKIISVDDRVVEPPHVWQTYLPRRLRDNGRRVERGTWADFRIRPRAVSDQRHVEGGRPRDGWMYEDRVIHAHERFVA